MYFQYTVSISIWESKNLLKNNMQILNLLYHDIVYYPGHKK